MISLRKFLLFLLVVTNVTPASATLYRTHVDQSGPPPGCFEPPVVRSRVTNPGDSGQIWDVIIMVNQWVDLGGFAGGYYTGPQPTGEVVRLMPGDEAWLWWARGHQTVGGSQVIGYNWAEYHVVDVSLVPEPVNHAVTVNVAPAGAGSVTGAGNYTEGDTVTMQAHSHAGYRFDHWTGSVTGAANPQSLTVDGPKTVTARFVPLSYTLNVNTQGSGTVSGAGTYQHGQTATLTASPASGWHFSGWSGAATGTATSVTVTMVADRSVTATFSRSQVTLSTAADSGGSVSTGGTYPQGTTVTVTATPDGHHDFAGWSGDAHGASPVVGVLMDRSKTIRARFARKHFSLTTSATAGGTVTPGGTYPSGSVVTISANPGANARFLNWTGDVTGTATHVAVTMDRSKSVQAVFATKAAQSIDFQPPADISPGAAPIGLQASASSGLPVTLQVLSGPATMSGNLLTVTGRGTITVRADQGGNAEYLAAPSVTRTFNAVGPAIVKYSAPSRTLLQTRQRSGQAPLILEQP